MDHKMRVELAIRHLPVDQIPCAELVIDDAVVQGLCGEKVIKFEHRLEFVRTMGLDAVCLHPEFCLQPDSIPLAQDAVFADLEQWAKTDCFIFALLDGPIGWGVKLLGFNQLMAKLARRHPDILMLMKDIERLNINIMEKLRHSGVNGVIIADDIAFNQGVIVRPDILRQTLFPALARQVESAKAFDLPVFFHADGNLMLVMEDIVEAGFDGLQCIESVAGMDIELIKRQYGQKLCLWGNLDPAELVMERSSSHLQNKVNNIINATGGHDGGLIFGTSSGLFEGIRLENLKHVYESVRKYGVTQGNVTEEI